MSMRLSVGMAFVVSCLPKVLLRSHDSCLYRTRKDNYARTAKMDTQRLNRGASIASVPTFPLWPLGCRSSVGISSWIPGVRCIPPRTVTSVIHWTTLTRRSAPGNNARRKTSGLSGANREGEISLFCCWKWSSPAFPYLPGTTTRRLWGFPAGGKLPQEQHPSRAKAPRRRVDTGTAGRKQTK